MSIVLWYCEYSGHTEGADNVCNVDGAYALSILMVYVMLIVLLL